MIVGKPACRLAFVLFGILIVLGSFAPLPAGAEAVYCTSARSGYWDDAQTWTNCAGGYPGAADNVKILAGHTVTIRSDVTVGGNLVVEGTLAGGSGRWLVFVGDQLLNSGIVSVPNVSFARDSRDGSQLLSGTGRLQGNTLTAYYGATLIIGGHSVHTLVILNRASVQLYGNLVVTGDFSNTGDFRSNLRAVAFQTPQASGAAPDAQTESLHNLTADLPLLFADLTIDSGNVVVETVSSNQVTVLGALVNNGVLRKSLAISGPATYDFGLTRVKVNVSAQGTLNALTVSRTDQNDPAATAGVRTGRYWILAPNSGATGYVATLTLPQSVGNPSACRYMGAYWDCAVSLVTDTEVSRDNATLTSDWAVGANIQPPVTPDPVVILLATPNVSFTWPAAGANAEGYMVSCSQSPYFDPVGPCTASARLPAGATGWTHPGAASDSTKSYFYLVRGINGAGVPSAPGARTGVFNFCLGTCTP